MGASVSYGNIFFVEILWCELDKTTYQYDASEQDVHQRAAYHLGQEVQGQADLQGQGEFLN